MNRFVLSGRSAPPPGLLWKFRPIVSRASRKRLQVRDPDLGQEVRGLALRGQLRRSCQSSPSHERHIYLPGIGDHNSIYVGRQHFSHGHSIPPPYRATSSTVRREQQPVDNTTNTDPRSQGIRARRKGGQITCSNSQFCIRWPTRTCVLPTTFRSLISTGSMPP